MRVVARRIIEMAQQGINNAVPNTISFSGKARANV
jgi:hypothetical protein